MTSQCQGTQTFQATLAQPLNFGHILEICGKAQQDAERISINFHKTKTTETYLQIVLDIFKKQITLTQFHTENNSIKNEVLIKDLILAEILNDFKFCIMMGEAKFHIALNNNRLANLRYTQHLEKLQIQCLEVLGKLEYINQLDHHKYFPHIWPPIQVNDHYLDFSNDQPMPFKPGHLMILSARLEGQSKGRFIIQFRHVRDNKRQELHVSVRFDTKKIIRNSKYRQPDEKLAFGPEEIDDDYSAANFPFEPFNKPFKLAVAFCEKEFRLAKDGKMLFNFSYRSPNLLHHVMGPKIFGTNGVNVRVWGIEHLCLEDDELCKDFEKYSI